MYIFPVHILRKINSKIILISFFITVLSTFLSGILEFYFIEYLTKDNQLLTVYAVRQNTEISWTLKNIILDNNEIVDVINNFFIKEMSGQLKSITGIIITAATMSYLVGGLLINRKVSKSKSKAKLIYRIDINKEINPPYRTLVECAYHGGEEYENLLLNNDRTVNIIMFNEKGIIIPDVSIKTRIINWCKGI